VKPTIAVCASCLLMFVFMLDQRSLAQVRTLSITDTKSVPSLVAEAIASPVKCDADGNIALRAVVFPGDLGPIVRLSANGEKAVSVRLSRDAEPRDAELIDLALGRSGLFVLASSEGHSWVLRYDADGNFDRAVPIEAPIEAARLAVDANENLVISGLTKGQSGNPGETFLGLFRDDGTLDKRLTFEQNPISKRRVKGGSVAKAFDAALRDTVLAAGQDGNLYFLQGSTLFIATPDGKVRRMRVDPPKGSVKTKTLVTDQRGRVVIEFLEFKPDSQNGEIKSVILQVIDPRISRAPLMTLSHANADIGPTLACYEGETFVFVNTDDHSHLQLVKTVAQ